MTDNTKRDFVHELDHSTPAAYHAGLGRVLASLVTQVTAVVADNVALRTKYAALLAHLDTANVAGIGNTNVATYAPAAAAAVAPAVLGG